MLGWDGQSRKQLIFGKMLQEVQIQTFKCDQNCDRIAKIDDDDAT